MKTNHKILLLLSPVATLIGCSDDFMPGGEMTPSLSPRYLGVSKNVFDHNSEAFNESFEVRSDNTSWNFSEVANWISLSPASGTNSATIGMSVEENTSADNARTAIFYLSSTDSGWNCKRAISVSQSSAEKRLSIETRSLSFGGASGSETLDVIANCEWSAYTSEQWIAVEADPTGNKLTVSVSQNNGSVSRNGIVKVKYGEASTIDIKVTQSPSDISANTYTLEYDNVASRQHVTVNSDVAWSAVTSEPWIQVEPDKGEAGSTTISIEVSPNESVSERTGYVNLRTGETDRIQIVVIQKGLYIETEASLLFGSNPEDKKLLIRSNTEWQIESAPEWVTISDKEGTGSKEITVSVADNPNTTSRNGNIVIGQPGLNIRATIEVTQSGKTFDTDSHLLEFDDKGGTLSFNIISDSQWSSVKNSDWFDVSPETGTGDTRVDVTAQENTSSDERVGLIEYRYVNKTMNVNVHQLAKYLKINNKTFNFASRGGKHDVALFTNDKWTATIEENASWLTLSQTSGAGNAEITITAADNPSVNSRSATILIETKNSQSVIIRINQDARTLSVSTREILFFAEGGTSETVQIKANGEYEILSDASWFTVNKNEGDSFTVYAAKNPLGDMRTGKIIIRMLGLTDEELSAEIKVTQSGEGGSFIHGDYPEDSNWDDVSAGTLTVTIGGFTPDNDWNGNGDSDAGFDKTEYPDDGDWNN